MTGFAAKTGEGQGYAWQWDIRGVNAKGFDLRLRIPDWIEGLEQSIKATASKKMVRGSININLRLTRDEATVPIEINTDQLNKLLDAIAHIEAQANRADVPLANVSAFDLLQHKSVYQAVAQTSDTTQLKALLLEDFKPVLDDFLNARQSEGAALQHVLENHITQIATLTDQAAIAAKARQGDAAEALKTALARVLENTDNVDEARVTQELALLAVKADITEEIDRLKAHVDAARDLLAADGPVGRKLDFLSQEFNREANTLCSKSGSVDLTRIGLDLKAVIDQMREQVQNVE
ncbi:YicC/YloC family endoribonuclease [Parasulfitobacter algicola]|uniref:YicC family protein n=1 Tax=Parasulfitobacter algicola TaxID=2614809 RepID=A0ABX2ISL7_9RHOB|nr:YicC/YloC family endoribonuclease [Sulfitobacter algicola]NSX55310.1 YicC family protein [Sulfitobacter algicola]